MTAPQFNGEVWYQRERSRGRSTVSHMEPARITAKRVTTEGRERVFDRITGKDKSAWHVQKDPAVMFAYRFNGGAWEMTSQPTEEE